MYTLWDNIAFRIGLTVSWYHMPHACTHTNTNTRSRPGCIHHDTRRLHNSKRHNSNSSTLKITPLYTVTIPPSQSLPSHPRSPSLTIPPLTLPHFPWPCVLPILWISEHPLAATDELSLQEYKGTNMYMCVWHWSVGIWHKIAQSACT